MQREREREREIEHSTQKKKSKKKKTEKKRDKSHWKAGLVTSHGCVPSNKTFHNSGGSDGGRAGQGSNNATSSLVCVAQVPSACGRGVARPVLEVDAVAAAACRRFIRSTRLLRPTDAAVQKEEGPNQPTRREGRERDAMAANQLGEVRV